MFSGALFPIHSQPSSTKIKKKPAKVSSQVNIIMSLWTTNQTSFLQHWEPVQVCLKYLATIIPKEAEPIQAPIMNAPWSLNKMSDLAFNCPTNPNFWKGKHSTFLCLCNYCCMFGHKINLCFLKHNCHNFATLD